MDLRMKSFAAGTFALMMAGSAAAAPVYTIRLQSFGSQAEADAAKGGFEGTFSPLWVQQEETSGTMTFAVMAGEFPSYPDAWAYSKNFSPGAAPDARAAIIQDASKSARTVKSTAETNVLPIEMPFLSEEELATTASKSAASPVKADEAKSLVASEPVPAELLSKSAASMTKQELVAVGMNASKNAQGVPALERFLSENPNDVQANQARLRLARRLLGRKDIAGARQLLETVKSSGADSEKSSARLIEAYVDLADSAKDPFNSFRAIANDPSVSPASRRDARLRIANAYHSKKNPATSWLAFRQIERDSNTAQQTEAKVQLAGLAFELAGSGKGSWPDVRKFCDAVTTSQNAAGDAKATAALMKLETYFEEGNMDSCLAAIDAFLAQYPTTPRREVAMAKLWKGIALTKKNNFAAAKPALAEVTQLPLDAADKFKGKEPHAIAYAWLGWIAKKESNAVELARVSAALQEEFPGHAATRRIAGYARSTQAPATPDAPPPAIPGGNQ